MPSNVKWIFGFVMLLFCSFGFGEESLPPNLHIGFTPSGNPQVLESGAKKICDGLSKKVGLKIEPVVAKNYSELIEKMQNGEVDFAFMSSTAFVEAEKTGSVKVLLKKVWAQPYYYSVLVVRKGSKIKKLQDLKGKKIAFVDKKSTSGYLYPLVELHKLGMTEKDFAEVIFSGSHARSVNMLEQKDIDAIAIFSDDVDAKTSAWQKFKSSTNIDIQKIWVSDPIPNDPFCVRTQFYEKFPKLTHTLMFDLIDEVEEMQADNDVRLLMGAKGFVPATSRQYDSIREMVKVLGAQADK